MKWGQVGHPGHQAPAATTTAPPADEASKGDDPRVFTGEYRHSVDGKGRVAVPARFRTQLADGVFVSRWIDQCLAVFPRSAWEALSEKVAGLPVADAGSRAFQRFLFGGAIETELDRSGRVLVPEYLRSWAGLEGDAVLVGSRDHAEIWAPGRWDDVRRGLENPDELAQHLSGLGI